MSLDEFKQFSQNMVKKIREDRKARNRAISESLNDPRRGYSLEDFDVRKRGDHFESYNKRTGKKLFEACSWSEAWADLREEFLVCS